MQCDEKEINILHRRLLCKTRVADFYLGLCKLQESDDLGSNQVAGCAVQRCGAVWVRAGEADQLGTWDSRATR